MKLGDFRALTFDCYGTLIDWERGLLAALRPLLARAPAPPDGDTVLQRFAALEDAEERAAPALRYDGVLARVHAALGRELDTPTTEEADRRFGASVGDWPAFPDSAAALAYLKQHYALVILSNVHRDGFRASNERLGVAFDAVFTAEDIGSYKPEPRNFATMLARLDELGFGKAEILHTAQSLFHDHVPANAIGLASCWIDRRAGKPGGATASPPAGVRYDFRFPSLAAMADAHRTERATA